MEFLHLLRKQPTNRNEKTIWPINYLMKEFHYFTSHTQVLHNNLFCCAIRLYFSIYQFIFFLTSIALHSATFSCCALHSIRITQAHSAGQSSNRMHCMHLIQYFNSFSHSLFISDTTMVYFHTFCQIDFRFVHSWLLFRSFACLSPCLRRHFVLIFASNVCWMSSACICVVLAEAQHFRTLDESFLRSHAALLLLLDSLPPTNHWKSFVLFESLESTKQIWRFKTKIIIHERNEFVPLVNRCMQQHALQQNGFPYWFMIMKWMRCAQNCSDSFV